MDRSNFNPDQLHEHFDRLKNDLGIELEDNARMIKLPTGHRFVLGAGSVMTGTGTRHHNDPKIHAAIPAGDTFFPLLTEAGEVGELHTTVYPDESMASITFDKDRETEPGSFSSRDVAHRVEWANELTTPLSVPQNDNRNKWYINPDSDTMDSIMKEVTERGGITHPETLQDAGTVGIEAHAGPDSGESWRTIGKMAMNRKSGRFEWIPD